MHLLKLLSAVAIASGISLAAAMPVIAAPMAVIGNPAGSIPVEFDVILPLRDRSGLDALVAAQHDPTSPLFHKWLTPQQVQDRFGPDPATISAVRAQLSTAGLSVTALGRALRVSGSAGATARALNTTLVMGRTATGGTHAFAATSLQPAGALGLAGATIVGLGRDRHEHVPFSQKVALPRDFAARPDARRSQNGPYWYDDLRQAYQYPSYQTTVTVNGHSQRLDGTGASIGIVMSSDVLDSDLDLMFDHENFRKNSGQAKNPRIFARRPVDGGGGTADQDGFGEASLDVQQALGGAPGARLVLYDTADLSDQDIIDAYLQVVSDNEVDVVSSSFGACELLYTAAYNGGVDQTADLDVEHEIFLQGNAQGITFLASSGDAAGRECPSTNYFNNGTKGAAVPSVSVPAADPNVTAVGGTNLVTATTAGSLDSSYLRENAYADPEIAQDRYHVGAQLSNLWWGAGGGISTYYARPDFQKQAGLNTGSDRYRTLPDIGMQVGGCPGGISVTPCNGGNSPLNGNGNAERSAVVVAEQGEFDGVIGTSVASPEFSSVVALLVEQYGRMGNLNTYLYAVGHAQTASGSNGTARVTTVYHRNIAGYNGVVSNNQPVNTLGAYYNFTTGNGTPIVYRLVGAPNVAQAGVPQTSSNP